MQIHDLSDPVSGIGIIILDSQHSFFLLACLNWFYLCCSNPPYNTLLIISVADPNPGLLDPDPLVRGMDPDPSRFKQK
jgi:hypothetical protein